MIAWLKRLFRLPRTTDLHDAPIPASVVVAQVTSAHDLLSHSELFALVTESLGADPFCNPRKALPELLQLVSHPDIGAFIAYDGETPRGFVLLQASQGLLEGCLVLQFYSRGGPGIRRALVRRTVTFARSRGTLRLIGMDSNDRPAVFCRMFRSVDLELVPRGRMFEFRIRPEESHELREENAVRHVAESPRPDAA